MTQFKKMKSNFGQFCLLIISVIGFPYVKCSKEHIQLALLSSTYDLGDSLKLPGELAVDDDQNSCASTGYRNDNAILVLFKEEQEIDTILMSALPRTELHVLITMGNHEGSVFRRPLDPSYVCGEFNMTTGENPKLRVTCKERRLARAILIEDRRLGANFFGLCEIDVAKDPVIVSAEVQSNSLDTISVFVGLAIGLAISIAFFVIYICTRPKQRKRLQIDSDTSYIEDPSPSTSIPRPPRAQGTPLPKLRLTHLSVQPGDRMSENMYSSIKSEGPEYLSLSEIGNTASLYQDVVPEALVKRSLPAPPGTYSNQFLRR